MHKTLALIVLAVAVLGAPIVGQAQVWGPTASMASARQEHTLTMLPGPGPGKKDVVLAAGGYPALTSAELYDVATGSWSATGSLATGRWDHTATLLPKGGVIVAGGQLYGVFLTSVEAYDPRTGAWSATGSLSTERIAHTATLLSTGKVLVAGGQGSNSGTQRSAELYDATMGTWSLTGTLAADRAWHTATLLESGEVLVVSGESSYGPSYCASTAELYNPATGTWSPAGTPVLGGRSGHTATLLQSGKVLIAGGTQCTTGVPLATAELYDPATGTWESTGSMNLSRGAGPAAERLTSGKVLIVGGDGTSPATAELYDPATGTWSWTGWTAAARFNPESVLLSSGEVLITGGNDGVNNLSTAELYAP